MTRTDVVNKYFDWLCEMVCEDRFSTQISYKKLLTFLYETDFRYSILKDQNRAEDGMDLRYRFSLHSGIEDAELYLDGNCSVLEMMIALAIRCEETLMDDPRIGNRTGQWFWGMITNLGLGSVTDSQFDNRRVGEVISRFLDREYEPDGRGGLFRVRNCDCDLRTVEIWYQLCYYLDTIV